ncbi:MAG: hypothetical protein AABX66_03070, partial [Nanoarchaeota archaeon]
MSSYSHKFEGNSPKYKKIDGRAVLMGAGETQLLDEILNDDFLDGFSDKSTEEIAQSIESKIKKIIQKRIESEILVKHGLNITSYISKSKELSQSLIDDIEDEKDKIMDYLDLEFILAGVDKDGKPRLFTITKTACYPHSTQTVAIIGSGTSFSNIELAREYRNEGIWLCEALLKVYKAKRLAENELHVGQKTDIGLIYASDDLLNGLSSIAIIEDFDDGLKELLEEELKEIKEKESKGLVKISEKLNNIFYNPANIQPQEEQSNKN